VEVRSEYIGDFEKFADHMSVVGNCCKVCGVPTRLKCQACMRVMYCSRECSKKNWKNHKRCCKKTRRESSMAGPVVGYGL
jgi:hypothetical protein